MFPQILGQENITCVKGCYWNFAITIESILLNLDRWQWSLIRNTSPLVNLWQISSEWCKILDSLHNQIDLQLHQKSLEQAVKNDSWSPYHLDMSLQCFFISIVRTQKLLFSGHMRVYRWEKYVKGKLTRLPWHHQNPRCFNGHHTY